MSFDDGTARVGKERHCAPDAGRQIAGAVKKSEIFVALVAFSAIFDAMSRHQHVTFVDNCSRTNRLKGCG